MNQKERIEQYLHKLCKEIGPRPTGSNANRAAVEFACAEFEAGGLSVERQEFDCMNWQNHGGTLKVDGQSATIAPAPYSLPCSVQAELICIRSVKQLRKADLTSKIVVLYGELCQEPLMPKSFMFWNPEEHQEIIALLERGKPCAVITASLDSNELIPVIEDGDFEIPCAVVSKSSLSLLLSGETAELTLRTDRSATRAANVIATYGDGPQKVCFSAHIDTAPGTPGALDNASGVAVLLALAASLRGNDYPYRIEFVLFNGEDYYSNAGEMIYLRSSLATPDEYICAFNVDGVGLRGSNISYSFYECPATLEEAVINLGRQTPEFEQIDPWPQGDHTLFAVSGVPAIAITSSKIFELLKSILHTENDKIELLDIDKLERLVDFLQHSI
ncbi:M28 family peptidase [Bacillus testis]|uniref:M28 family peptidase n=1 Tax=Bacillus testis TaxID=1622072 RepID=UPI00067F00D8|nr:M28 family peptidase [Bacillus testis]